MSFFKHSVSCRRYQLIFPHIIFNYIIPVVFYANKESVGPSKPTDLCILCIITTTCFGRCRPSSGHKFYHKGKLYRLKVLVVVQILSYQRDLVVYRHLYAESPATNYARDNKSRTNRAEDTSINSTCVPLKLYLLRI
jgi:hypothetical protein